MICIDIIQIVTLAGLLLTASSTYILAGDKESTYFTLIELAFQLILIIYRTLIFGYS